MSDLSFEFIINNCKTIGDLKYRIEEIKNEKD